MKKEDQYSEQQTKNINTNFPTALKILITTYCTSSHPNPHRHTLAFSSLFHSHPRRLLSKDPEITLPQAIIRVPQCILASTCSLAQLSMCVTRKLAASEIDGRFCRWSLALAGLAKGCVVSACTLWCSTTTTPVASHMANAA